MLFNPIFSGAVELILAAMNCPPIKRGDRGPGVALLQQALVGLGYAMPRSTGPDGCMDGIFGGEMHDTVCRFQVRNGLANTRGFGDGIIGAMTMALFDRLVSGLTAPTISAGDTRVPKPVTPTSLPPARAMTVPEGDRLLAAYEGFKTVNGKPCARSGNNQCAIRMSVALAKADCGFSFARLKNQSGVHSGDGGCGGTSAHIDSATALADYLWRLHLPVEFYKLDKTTGQKVFERAGGRKGIVYLKKCFPLNGGRGSHIDYWDGTELMNHRMNYRGQGEPQSSRSFFTASREKIWFFPVR